MSCCTPVRANTRDPTNTRGLQKDLLEDIQRRFQRLKTAIRQKVGYQNDALHLMQDAPGSLLAANEKDRFEFVTRDDLITTFIRWLKTQIDDEILEPATEQAVRDGQHWLAPYIKAAAERGYQNATGRLMQAGVSVESRDLEVVFNLPVHRRQLQDLYTRAYANLKSITDDMADEIRDELTQGLADGDNPREMARRLTNRIETLRRTRAEVLARSEIIHSHTSETLTRYGEAPGEVGVNHAGWLAADDTRTCPFCRRLDGVTLTLREAREGAVEWRGQVYRLAPPSHPAGRCSLTPAVGVDLGSLPPLAERVPGTVLSGG